MHSTRAFILSQCAVYWNGSVEERKGGKKKRILFVVQ